jgi:hypothetical protein
MPAVSFNFSAGKIFADNGQGDFHQEWPCFNQDNW